MFLKKKDGIVAFVYEKNITNLSQRRKKTRKTIPN